MIGDTSRTPASLTEAMLATGMTHLSAVSGSNVAVVLAAGIGLCRVLGIRRRWRPVVAASPAGRLRGPRPARAQRAPGRRHGGDRADGAERLASASRRPGAGRCRGGAAGDRPVAVAIVRLRPLDAGDAGAAALRRHVGSVVRPLPARPPALAGRRDRDPGGGAGDVRSGGGAAAGFGQRGRGAGEPARCAAGRAGHRAGGHGGTARGRRRSRRGGRGLGRRCCRRPGSPGWHDPAPTCRWARCPGPTGHRGRSCWPG